MNYSFWGVSGAFIDLARHAEVTWYSGIAVGNPVTRIAGHETDTPCDILPDVIHSVEDMHTGPSDSSVMYIGATPLSPHNVRYLVGHRDNFLKRIPPPDFPQGNGLGESQFVGHGEESDMTPEGLVAMGLRPFTAKEGASRGAKEAVKDANAILGLA